QFQPFKSCNLKDQDFCQVDDEAKGEGVYVDLMKNPERFTGYSGPSAARVWDAIYHENCFNVAHRMQMAADCEQCQLDREKAAAAALEAQKMADHRQMMSSTSGSGGGGGGTGGFSSAAARPVGGGLGMASVFGSKVGGAGSPPERRQFPLGSASQDEEDMCLEKRVFYRMISGLHASISIHICDEYFNQTTGVWGPNLECFVERVGSHPDRMENLFFDYSMLLRAVSKMSRYLKDYAFCTGNAEADMQVKGMVDKFIETAQRAPASFDEKVMFVGPAAKQLKTEFRDHYRNITRIMDCVGCEKCRLWGKVQTSGLATALKVLFSYNDESFSSGSANHPVLLQRTEIVALFNTLNRFSESIESIARFRKLYLEEYGYREPAYWTHTPPPTSSTESEAEQAEANMIEELLEDERYTVVPPPPMETANFDEAPSADGDTQEHPELSVLDATVDVVSLEALVLDNDSQQVVVVGRDEGAGAVKSIHTAFVKDGESIIENESVSGFLSQFLQRIAQPTDDGGSSSKGVVPMKQKQQEQQQQQPPIVAPRRGDKVQASKVASMVVELREKVVLRFYHARSWLASLFENRYNRVNIV
ncbi:hypothetical protein DFQ26_008791, partial [Actinomortierella ambigua]